MEIIGKIQKMSKGNKGLILLDKCFDPGTPSMKKEDNQRGGGGRGGMLFIVATNIVAS